MTTSTEQQPAPDAPLAAEPAPAPAEDAPDSAADGASDMQPETGAPPVEDAAVAVEDAAASAEPPATVAPDLSPAATGARLAALFPALFVGPDGKGTWRAIKLRIHADIQARAPGEFSKRALGIFFSRYTTTTAYLKALAAPGAQRHDLDGQPAGEIAEEHRAAAAEEVARRQAMAAERRAAFRKPVPRAPAAPTQGDGAAAPTEQGHIDAQRRAGARARPPRGEPRRDPGRAQHRDAGDDRSAGAPRRGPGGPRPAPRNEAPARRDARPAPYAEPERSAAALPTDPAQRERALLLRAFESSPLSKSNFCALKRISESELDQQLAQAREERGGRKA